MLHIFGEALLLLVGQGQAKVQRKDPKGLRAEWRRPKGTPRLG